MTRIFFFNCLKKNCKIKEYLHDFPRVFSTCTSVYTESLKSQFSAQNMTQKISHKQPL